MCPAHLLQSPLYLLIFTANTLSFEVNRLFVNESDGSVEVCVHGGGRVSQFQVITSDIDARGKNQQYLVIINQTVKSTEKC